MPVYTINKSTVLNRMVILIILLISISCTQQDSETQACAITVDSVSIIDSMELKGVTYFLVYRVSGWSDKTEILELYDSKPIFDHCAISKIEPVDGDSLEMSKTISNVYLNTKDKTIDIVYREGKPDKMHNSNLKLEIK